MKSYCWVIIMVGLVLSSFLALPFIQAATLLDGIKDYWSFDKVIPPNVTNEVNSSVDGMNGTLWNTPTQINGKVGFGMQFIGDSVTPANSQFMNTSIQNITTINNPVAQNYSFNFWANLTGTTAAGRMILSDAAGNNFFRFNSAGTTINVQNSMALTGNVANAINGWQMYTFVYNRDTDNMTIYQNGTSIASSILGGAGRKDMIINYFTTFNALTQNLNGSLDEIGIWNRTLSQDEIQTLYNKNMGFTYPFTTDINNRSEYNFTTYETKSESFLLNQSYPLTYSSISATFVYNGVNYTATASPYGNNVSLSTTIDIPSNLGTSLFNWTIYTTNSSGTFAYQTATFSQVVSQIYFVLCNSTFSTPYVNYTFIDEENGSSINASISSSFVYYLGSGSVTKTLSYINIPEYNSYAFCLSANTLPLFATPTIQYFNSQSTTRTYSTSSPLNLTNSVTNIALYLLRTADGIFSSYQVSTSTLQPLANAMITFTLGGITIESKLTDGSGIATFFLNPNSLYTLVASRSGYNSFSTTIFPTQSTYTITLSPVGSGNITAFNQGINYFIEPTDSYLLNKTIYNFNASLNSSFLNIDSWGFNITNGSTYLDSQNGVGGVGALGNINKNFNTGNYTTLTLRLFWIVNGTETFTSKTFTIQNLQGNEWSIYNSILDLQTYLTSGFFGLTPMGLNIIIFITIFSITGILAFKFGLYSPAALATVIFVLVLIFDVVLGLVYYDSTIFVNKVPHFATAFMGIIALALGIKEGTSY